MFLFSPGAIVATPGALAAFEEAREDPSAYLRRHLSGDWGDVDEFDKLQNEERVGERLSHPLGVCARQRHAHLDHHRGG